MKEKGNFININSFNFGLLLMVEKKESTVCDCQLLEPREENEEKVFLLNGYTWEKKSSEIYRCKTANHGFIHMHSNDEGAMVIVFPENLPVASYMLIWNPKILKYLANKEELRSMDIDVQSEQGTLWFRSSKKMCW